MFQREWSTSLPVSPSIDKGQAGSKIVRTNRSACWQIKCRGGERERERKPGGRIGYRTNLIVFFFVTLRASSGVHVGAPSRGGDVELREVDHPAGGVPGRLHDDADHPPRDHGRRGHLLAGGQEQERRREGRPRPHRARPLPRLRLLPLPQGRQDVLVQPILHRVSTYLMMMTRRRLSDP